MVHESSMHQACIENRLEHADMMDVKTKKYNTCKKVPEEIKEIIIPH